MALVLLVKNYPQRSLILRPAAASVPSSPTGVVPPGSPHQASYALILENIKVPATTSTSSPDQCAARFVATNEPGYTEEGFRPIATSPAQRATGYAGCVGLVHLAEGLFVGVISQWTTVGHIEGQAVHALNKVEFYSLTSSRYDRLDATGTQYIVEQLTTRSAYDGTSMTQEEVVQDMLFPHPCAELIKYMHAGSFHFSFGFDLTRSMQRRHLDATSTLSSHWDLLDDRFFFNQYILQELVRFRDQLPEPQKLDGANLLVPLLQGYVGIEEGTLIGGNGSGRQQMNVKVAVISRLSHKRAGVRFQTRGIDDEGHVANFVESETLIYLNEQYAASIIIVRGSVPIFWEQQGLQLGGHKIQISRSRDATKPAFQLHMQSLLDRYNQVALLNLLSESTPAEVQLSTEYEAQVQHLGPPNTVKYLAYDVNAVTRGNNFGVLQGYSRERGRDLEAFQLFCQDLTLDTPISLQQGIFRVNCIDCLDRTNLMQSYLVKQALSTFTLQFGVDINSLWEKYIQRLWADNGDTLSKLYTGTAALKSDITRGGVRSALGMLADAKKSVNRFYVNMFQDKGRQDIIDLLLGNSAEQRAVVLYNPVHQAVMQQMMAYEHEFSTKSTLSIFVGTWNVNARAPGESLTPYVSSAFASAPDVFCFGFQEIVDLSAQQILSTDPGKRIAWEEDILYQLNHRNTSGDTYIILKSAQLVGVSLSIFVKERLSSNLRRVQTESKKTGLAGLSGNKGGVAIRFDYFDTSFCFVCAHLASGSSNWDDRNRDFHTIQSGIAFKGRAVESHERIFFFGDFNYRLDELSSDDVRQQVLSGQVEKLLAYDQLTRQRQRGTAFADFEESLIAFSPTYKYDNGTDEFDSSEKHRAPAWTDRILYKGSGIQACSYRSIPQMKTSDHKPVCAIFKVDVLQIDARAKMARLKALYKAALQDSLQARSPGHGPTVGPAPPPLPVKERQPLQAMADLLDLSPLAVSDATSSQQGSLQNASSISNVPVYTSTPSGGQPINASLIAPLIPTPKSGAPVAPPALPPRR